MNKIIKSLIYVLVFFSLINGVSAAGYRTDYKSLALSEYDIKLIAKAVRAEASAECYLAKACVAAIILNRMKDPLLQANAESTIYAEGAFLFADKASIDLPVSDEELFEYVSLVKLIVEYGIDPTCGALFCFTEGDREARRFIITISIDGLLFARP